VTAAIVHGGYCRAIRLAWHHLVADAGNAWQSPVRTHQLGRWITDPLRIDQRPILTPLSHESRTVALAPSELAGVAETARARVAC
jgi:hypothetical protein